MKLPTGHDLDDPTAPVEAHLADVTLRVLFFTCVPLLTLSLLRILEIGWLPVMGLHIALVAALGLATRVRQRMTTRAKGALLIVFFVAIGVGTIVTNDGFIYGAPYFFIVLLFSSIFFPLRTTAALMLLTLGFQGAHEWSKGALTIHDLLTLLAISTLSLIAVYALSTLKAALAAAVSTLGEQNEHLREAREEALAASQAKSDFLANMSHELRTPMSAILGVADLLREHPLGSEDSEYVEMIRSSGDVLLTLLNDILDLSKIEASKLEIEELPISVADIVDDVATMMRVRAEHKGLRLDVRMPSRALPTVAADPTRLRQLLLNLIGNAVKFTERGEVVLQIEARAATAELLTLRFAVCDSGIGIAADKLPRLFNVFHQVDSSTTRRFGGTGLGLAICKQLVEMMGGEIGVRSELGAGSEFWFTLPLKLSTRAPEKRVAKQSPCVPLDTAATILLAEDNPVLQLIAKTLLEKIGFNDIDIVGDGRQALDQLGQRDYDLVLMDIQMPELDGLEAVRRLRAGGGRNHAVPVIALTASAMKGYDEICRAAGMSDYLSKPINVDRLRATLGAWLPRAPEPAPRAFHSRPRPLSAPFPAAIPT